MSPVSGSTLIFDLLSRQICHQNVDNRVKISVGFEYDYRLLIKYDFKGFLRFFVIFLVLKKNVDVWRER